MGKKLKFENKTLAQDECILSSLGKIFCYQHQHYHYDYYYYYYRPHGSTLKEKIN